MMIDKIYLAKRVEASGGQLFGLNDNCQVRTTVLYDQISFKFISKYDWYTFCEKS